MRKGRETKEGERARENWGELEDSYRRGQKRQGGSTESFIGTRRRSFSEGVSPRQRPLSGSRCQDSPAPRRLPAVLVAWHDSRPDFSIHVGGRLRCLNPFPREDLFVTPTTSHLHCKMRTLSASVE